MRHCPVSVCLTAFLLLSSPVRAEEQQSVASAEDIEFFEARIRPVLAKHCYECHSSKSETIQGGLRLDLAATSLKGGDTGPAVVAGKPEKSLLLSAIRYEDFEMPPTERLSPKVIADFEHWIQRGAADPRTNGDAASGIDDGIDIESGRQFWAFQPPKAANLPDELTASERIDRLIQKQLVEAGISPGAAADRRTLLRRVSFDITGLPPTRAEVDAFDADDQPGAFARQVDRLLNSPRYGERWARVWLDTARFAEDQAHIVGNNKALFYPNAWMYRDWVIKTFNQDVPYDRFVLLQLAADLVEPDSDENAAALGFIGLGPKYYRRNDPEVMADEWEDRVDVVGRGLQGLTVACARCHDHKYDPVATEDYYALAGVFAGTEMFNRPLSDDVEKGKDGQAKEPVKSMHVVRDSKPRDLAVMIRGDVNNKGDVVARGFLQVMYPGERRTFTEGSGRLELAQCITDPGNPLTARVFVNRIWQQYFGRGIVGTASNFGQLGERPSHPELLDDLAVGFMNNGWSIKWLHRQIVLSETYRRSSAITDAAARIDPDNRLLWRMNRRRLSVEGWRDAVLAVSGQLSEDVGGPSIRPDDPKEIRRTVYSQVSRFQLNPLLALFDFPDPNSHSAVRVETNTPLQKLFLMNSPFMTARAAAITEEVASSPDDSGAVVTSLFQRLFQRMPDESELSAAQDFLKSRPTDGGTQLAQVLMSSNEFWFVD